MAESLKAGILTCFLIFSLASCTVHPIVSVQSSAGNLLQGESSLAIESGVLNTTTVLFPNGIAFFSSEQWLEDEALFNGSDPYECRYCWGKYQYDDSVITVFKPLAVGILNLPGSYPIEKKMYKFNDAKSELFDETGKKVLMNKKKPFIDPDKSWLLNKTR